MKSLWAESIQMQCQDAEVPFFFKQWGGVRKHRTGRTLNGRIFDEMPDSIGIGLQDNNLVQIAS